MDNDENHKAHDSKRRLRWSCELHHRFIDAVNQLGGPYKATPKGLMRILEIPELTLYHLKSHLQKYRLGMTERFVGNKQDAAKSQECQNQKDFGDQVDITVTEEKDDQPNTNLQIKEAIEIQLEVQKKLHEQIEVQRQLQVRIEAQGKYLQSVLVKAQETLSAHTSSNLGIDFLRSDLCGVASIPNRSGLSPSFSELTQADEVEEIEEEEGFLESKVPENRGIRQSRNVVDSSLAPPESSEAETDFDFMRVRKRSNEIQLMKIKPEEVMERKKRRWSDVVSVEQPIRKRAFTGHDGEDLGLRLNSFKDMETCPKSDKQD